jgi:hypothetical protein
MHPELSGELLRFRRMHRDLCLFREPGVPGLSVLHTSMFGDNMRRLQRLRRNLRMSRRKIMQCDYPSVLEYPDVLGHVL